VSLLGLVLVHALLFPIAPFFTATVLTSIANDYRVRAKAHRDHACVRAHLAWHVDHHLGKNQNLNCCVTHPLFDWVMGTRERGEATPLAPTARA